MPKETFLKLSENKKKKIIDAAKKEFARVPIEQASIKNIVEKADIARGSFYQYFEDKQDLLKYILENHFKEMNNNLKTQIIQSKGDIFNIFLIIYDFLNENCCDENDIDFYRKIFENIKTSEDSMILKEIIKEEPKKIVDFYEYIDKENLKINSKQDLEIIEKILFAITTKAIVMRFKYETKEQARKEYLKQIEYLKYGILKEKEGKKC